MPIPTVQVPNGNQVLNGPVESDEPFQWKCDSCTPGATVTVTAADMPTPPGGPWFTPGQVSFTAPGPSQSVTPQAPSPVGGWGYSANIPITYAHVSVGSSVEKHAKKAS
jgi:hypothetical protein